MQILAEKQKATQTTTTAKSKHVGRAHREQRHDVDSIHHLQRMLGNQAGEGLWGSGAVDIGGGSHAAGISRFGHNADRSPIHSRSRGIIQAKLTINEPGDRYEQEADRVSDQVMRMEDPEVARTAPPAIQRMCAECEEEESVQRRSTPIGEGIANDEMQRSAESKVDAVNGGVPLTHEQRAFFEPRFGADFSRVRIHADGSADAAARSIGAYAYTRGSDIVFRGDQYHPNTFDGRRLLAHELTHVVQQGAAARVQRPAGSDLGGRHGQSNTPHVGTANGMVQRWPGDGMTPPGDCGWGKYLILRGSVETAKAVVSTLGGCSPGDSCLLLATKIAAIAAEIAARVALDSTCFRGGDEGHRRQVEDKVNMLNRCQRFFSGSNCPPELITAMEVVVERAREVIAAAAIIVALALIVALVAALIALVKVIIALLAAAAEGAAVVAAAAAVLALLVSLKEELEDA